MPNNTIAKKQSGWTVVSTLPDVCKTPMGSSMVPVPYPVTAKLTDSSSTSANVSSNSHPVFLFDESMVVKTFGVHSGVC